MFRGRPNSGRYNWPRNNDGQRYGGSNNEDRTYNGAVFKNRDKQNDVNSVLKVISLSLFIVDSRNFLTEASFYLTFLPSPLPA